MKSSADDELRSRLSLALGLHQRGQLAQAESLYRQILREHPSSFDAWHLLGIMRTDQGAPDEGVALIRRALSIDARSAVPHYSLAQALAAKGDDQGALASVDAALTRQRTYAEAWLLRGNLWLKLSQPIQAADSYREAIRQNPKFTAAFNNLATVLRELRQQREALDSVNRALALDPTHARALNNRGLLRLDARQGEAAVEDFISALRLNAQFPEAWHNLGTALTRLGRFAEASDAFSRLVRINSKFPHALGNLVHAKLCECEWRGLPPLIEAVIQGIARGEHAALPATFLSICGTAALQKQCAQSYSASQYPTLPTRSLPRSSAGDRIRVAYLSGDFGEHAVTYLLAGVFERHDTSRFETIAFSWDRHTEGAARRRVEAAFSQFIDVTDLSDEYVAQKMRDMRVDIAVDLCGHTLGQRTRVFAARPAPVQINYLGLPMTMGAPYIDYIIADQRLIPEHLRAGYSESVVWMPECFQPNDDRRNLPSMRTSRAQHGLPHQGFVFCSFNRNHKVTPAIFAVWMRLLGAVPDSALWLLAVNERTSGNLRREATALGIAPERLIFAGEVAYLEYLERYRHVDLFLDTHPFNGGATVSDALSMGVPVLSMAGEAFAARMAMSALSSLGLAELSSASLAEYELRALRIARDPEYLADLKTRLQAGQSYFDTDRYRRHLESAYTAMWRRHQAGLPPSALDIPLETL